jgi:hypothetical protein
MQDNEAIDRFLEEENPAALICFACWLTSCFCCLYLAIIGVFVSYFAFGIMFLIKDKSVGSDSCPAEAHALYMYCVLSFALKSGLGLFIAFGAACYQGLVVLQELAANQDQLPNEEIEAAIQWRGVKAAYRYFSAYSFVVVNGFIVYGMYTIYGLSFCPDVTHSGLWIWAQVTLWLDVIGELSFCLQFYCVFYYKETTSTTLPSSSSLTTNLLLERATSFSEVPNSMRIQLPSLAEWSVCCYVHGSFQFLFFQTEIRAQQCYRQLYGQSKIIASNETIRDSYFANQLWETTLKQYWNAYRKREQLRIILSQNSQYDVSLTRLSFWSVCYHKNNQGFICEIFDNEMNALDVYRRCDTWCTRLLGHGLNVIEEWSATNDWKSTVRQYWLVYIEWRYHLQEYPQANDAANNL